MSNLRPIPHTNCCGVNIIIPFTQVPRLLGPHQSDEIAEAFRVGLPKQKATALVRYFFVPDRFTKEFTELVAEHADKGNFRLVARRKKGDLYILCNPPKSVK